MTRDERKQLMDLFGDLSRASYMYGWHAARHDVEAYAYKDKEQLLWFKIHNTLQAMEDQYADL